MHESMPRMLVLLHTQPKTNYAGTVQQTIIRPMDFFQ